MRKTLSIACLHLALLGAPATALAFVTAFVSQTGPASIVDNEAKVSGRAAAELAGGASEGAGSYAYVGSAYADTRRGALGGAVTTTGSGYEADSRRLRVHASASFIEMVTVSVTGPVTFRLSVQGSFTADDGGQASSFASLGIAAMIPSSASAFARGSLYFDTSNVRGGTVISALRSNYIVWLEDTFVATALVPFPVAAKLEVFGSPPITGSVQALFGHTAQLEIFVPDGVSFTSESGDFLADVRTPVPEPATLWLWLLGVLLAAGTGRPRVIRLSPSATRNTHLNNFSTSAG